VWDLKQDTSYTNSDLICIQVGTCVEIGIPMLILFVIFSQVYVKQADYKVHV